MKATRRLQNCRGMMLCGIRFSLASPLLQTKLREFPSSMVIILFEKPAFVTLTT